MAKPKFKIFYHPLTHQIMGGSDGEVSMDFPYVETTTYYHSFKNLKIELDSKKKPKLVVAKGTLDEEDIKHLK